MTNNVLVLISDEFDAPQTAAQLKAEIATTKANKDAVRAYEKEKAKAGNVSVITENMMDETTTTAVNTSNNPVANISANSESLNQLWQRVRYFLNGKDDLGNDVEHGRPGRVRFTELCELKAVGRSGA